VLIPFVIQADGGDGAAVDGVILAEDSKEFAGDRTASHQGFAGEGNGVAGFRHDGGAGEGGGCHGVQTVAGTGSGRGDWASLAPFARIHCSTMTRLNSSLWLSWRPDACSSSRFRTGA